MSNAQRALDHLSEAARLLAIAKDGPTNFSNLIEAMVERAAGNDQADMVCSMLYAARESVEMRNVDRLKG